MTACPDDPHPDDIRTNPSTETPLSALIGQRLSRRRLLQGLSAAPAALLATTALSLPGRALAQPKDLPFGFAEIPHGSDAKSHVPEGYREQVLLRWGDPILPHSPDFDPQAQTPEKQVRQFGFNCDYIAFMPLPKGSATAGHGLLCVNHEFVQPAMMHPAPAKTTNEYERQARVEMAAVGHTVVEVRRTRKGWEVQTGSPYNRRFEALTTTYRISGPAAGHDRMKTGYDPSGTQVRGMAGNCAGGVTPWGTVLTCEENINFFFIGVTDVEQENYRRMGIGANDGRAVRWGEVDPRFQLAKEPLEPNRYGWVVEIDPYDPESIPVKRTALGRFKHECATVALARDNRAVVYSGDDQHFEFLYKFITEQPFDPANRASHRTLLDAGTLYVARFSGAGNLNWLPLVFGNDKLTPANGFFSQADVVIEARRAATLMGATPMDRPEDIALDPKTGRLYVMLTKNEKREPDQLNVANPRPNNRFGHVIEITPGAGDHGNDVARWDFLLMGGNPGKPDHKAVSHAATSPNGWLACPDNGTFDSRGNLWITTDGMQEAVGVADGVYATVTRGPYRGYTRQFYRAPVGAECTGPCFSPDDTTLFVSVQHPGEGGGTFANPSTRWPDFKAGMPPRPSVVALMKEDGGQVGT